MQVPSRTYSTRIREGGKTPLTFSTMNALQINFSRSTQAPRLKVCLKADTDRLIEEIKTAYGTEVATITVVDQDFVPTRCIVCSL